MRVHHDPPLAARPTPALAAVLVLACGAADHHRELIHSRGSDTMVNLVQAWAEEFELAQTEVSVAVSGGGSGTGIAALVNGTAELAASSRPVGDKERREAEARRGQPIVEHVVALDAIVVFVHPTNPLAAIDFTQLACIYGEGGDCDDWEDLGVSVPGCPDDRIVRIGRQSNSGTAQYFRATILGDHRDLRLGSLDLNGSSEAVRLAADTPCAIGYVGLGYLSPRIKALCVAPAPGEPCVPPNPRTAASRAYPISRSLFLVTLGPPRGAVQSFLDWVRSPHGVRILEATGYVAPLGSGAAG